MTPAAIIGQWRGHLVLATKRHPRTVQVQRRRRNKVARASRKHNRG